MLDNLILGFQTALTPENMLWCFVGVLLGTVIGLMPGLGSTTGVAILIPVTLTLEPVTALIMLAGIYYGAQYGGTITSVLISTPGEAASVVTHARRLPDGARKGRSRPGAARLAHRLVRRRDHLARAAHGARTASRSLALNFGPVENLSIMILGTRHRRELRGRIHGSGTR